MRYTEEQFYANASRRAAWLAKREAGIMPTAIAAEYGVSIQLVCCGIHKAKLERINPPVYPTNTRPKVVLPQVPMFWGMPHVG